MLASSRFSKIKMKITLFKYDKDLPDALKFTIYFSKTSKQLEDLKVSKFRKKISCSYVNQKTNEIIF